MMRRFIWIILSGILFIVMLGNFIFSQYRLRSAVNQAREHLMLIASNGVLLVDVEALLSVPLIQSAEGGPEYRQISRQLEKIKESNSAIKYVYIMTPSEEAGFMQFVVDADPVPEIITAHCPTSLPGDKYDVRNLPGIIAAFDGPSADKDINTDAWGVFISGYAPIRDNEGKSVAILGIDFDGSFIQKMEKKAKRSGLAALLTGILFIISFLSLKSWRIATSLKS